MSCFHPNEPRLIVEPASTDKSKRNRLMNTSHTLYEEILNVLHIPSFIRYLLRLWVTHSGRLDDKLLV